MALMTLAGCEEDSSSTEEPEAPTFEAVYVANSGSGTISGFLLDTDTGDLTEMDGSPFVSRAGSRMLAIDPDGKFLFSANSTHQSVSVLEIEAGTGQLTRLSSPAVGDTPRSVAVTPDGAFLYASVAPTTFGVVGWEVDSGSGDLTEITGSPFLPGIDSMEHVTIEPNGEFLYVTCPGYDSLCRQDINPATGELTPDSPPDYVPADSTPNFVAMHPTKGFECTLALGGPAVVCYTIANNGDVTSTGFEFTGTNADTMVLHPTEDLGYLTSDDGITGLTIDSSGVPSLIPTGFPVTDATEPTGTAIDPAGKYLLVTDRSAKRLRVYEIDAASGALEFLDEYTTGSAPIGVLSATLQ